MNVLQGDLATQARREFREAWANAPDRSAVITAAEAITRELAQDPDLKGRATDGYRVYTHPPLSVLYYIAPSVQVVWVTSVNPRWPGTP